MTQFLRSGASVKRYLADRLDLLQQTLEHLGARLRAGIAAEIGQAVRDAAEVAVRAVLAATQQPSPAAPDPGRYDPYPPYPPADAGYYDGWAEPPYDPGPDVSPRPTVPARPSRWKLALRVGVQVLAFWLRKPAGGRPFLTAIGVAAVTCAAALLGGPAGATGAAVVGTALSLVAMTDGTRAWVARLFRAASAT